MRTGLIAKALSRRFDFTRLTAAALARIARSPSYRAPSARDLHNPETFHPPTEHSPLEAFGARDLVVRDDAAVGLSLSGRSFISNGAVLVRKIPLRAVRLVAVQPFMSELARCPHLAGLRRLDLSGNRIGVEGMRELANSPYLGGLRELILSENDLGPEGAQWLARAPWFANLEQLEAAVNGIGTDELESILAAAANLVHLDLSRNPLGREGGAVLAGWPGAARLESIAAPGCGLGPDGTRDLLRGDFRSLRRLDLSFNRIGPGIAVTLPRLLTGLDLGFNDLGDPGIATLTAIPPPATLTSLNLAANRISPAGLRRLAESGWLTSIESLNLDINPIE
jgi:Leucine-rich repeat (LRR) protein